VSSARDGTVRLWDLRSGGRTVELLRFGSSRLAAGNEFGLSAGLSEYSSHVGRGSSTSLAAMGGTASPVVGSGVGDVQFDSRKIVAASDNGVEVCQCSYEPRLFDHNALLDRSSTVLVNSTPRLLSVGTRALPNDCGILIAILSRADETRRSKSGRYRWMFMKLTFEQVERIKIYVYICYRSHAVPIQCVSYDMAMICGLDIIYCEVMEE
jgi:hypothetical protein